MVGSLYPEGDKRIDSAFTIFYMGINLGAFFAPLVCGYVGDTGNPADFKWGFLSACIGMILGVITFELLKNKHIVRPDGSPVGMSPSHKSNGKDEKSQVSDAPLTKIEKERIAVIFILSFFVIFFWAAFEQAGASLTFFADEQTNRQLTADYAVPASFFQSVNPVAIILLAPLFAMLWTMLGKKNAEPSSPLKMAIGLFLLAIGYLVIAFGVKGIEPGAKVSMMWLLMMYTIHTMGELCLSPIGLSMVNKLSPVKFASLLMGVWFLSTAAANKFAGVLSSLYPPGDGDIAKATAKGINLKDILEGKIQATAEQISALKELGLPHEYASMLGFQVTSLYDFFMIFVFMAGAASLVLFFTYRKMLSMMHGIQ
jgi:POT family proton-dependent oligopeptide transporter